MTKRKHDPASRIEVELRPVTGYEGIYSVTADGRIFSHARTIVEARRAIRKRPCWLMPKKHRGGYVVAQLSREGKVEELLVHRIVCEAFNGPAPAPGLIVRHLDGNKRNNTPGNVAWGTHLDNAADAIRLGETVNGERNGQAKLTAAQALAIFNDSRSQRLVAAEYGVHQVTVSLIRRGKNWRHVTGAAFPILLTAPVVQQQDVEEA